MTQFRYTTLAHTDHSVMSPLSDETCGRLLDALDVAPGDRVLDIGCGNGEMLARLAQTRGICGIGLDRNPAMIARAIARAVGRGIDGALPHEETLEWICAEASGHPLLERKFDAVLCVGATGALGGLGPALVTLRDLLVPGGKALVGEGYWRCEPDPEYLAILGAPRDEMLDLVGLQRTVTAAGFDVLLTHASTEAEWDVYEGLYASAVERFVTAHPDDADAAEYSERIARWRDAYDRWGRATLGFATMVLSRRSSSDAGDG